MAAEVVMLDSALGDSHLTQALESCSASFASRMELSCILWALMFSSIKFSLQLSSCGGRAGRSFEQGVWMEGSNTAMPRDLVLGCYRAALTRKVSNLAKGQLMTPMKQNLRPGN